MTNVLGTANGFARNVVPADRSTLKFFNASRMSVRTVGSEGERKTAEALPPKELISNDLLAALSGDDFARLVPDLELAPLSFGERLYDSDEPARFVYFPEDSVVSCLSAMEDGSTTEVSMTGREGVVGLSTIFGSTLPTQWTQTIVAGSVLRMRADVFKESFNHDSMLKQLVLNYVGRYINQISRRAVCNSQHRLEARFASWLLMLHDRINNDDLAFTHEMIANHLGTRRAGISVAAKDLENNRIISYGRGHIRILDRHALEARTCECYRVLVAG